MLFDMSYTAPLTKHNFIESEFLFLDIESSGFGDASYPIEVAWMSEQGLSDDFLIKPCADWLERGYWDDHAEHSVHGISKAQLLAEGIDTFSAVSRLNESLQGKLLFCDMLALDGEWLTTLFIQARVAPFFKLADINQLYEFWGADKTDAFKQIINQLARDKQHRARSDAEHYIQAFKQLPEALARHFE
ncbi:hypothetical protein D210916BOD24_23340 [Alteromonas sp. D210916BOD_24]|uniref:hypothetical protein n=1 Tax=Alteromonas sp. D210916BOD_24 TaxID=3157618 RepID=UPI00399C7DCA